MVNIMSEYTNFATNCINRYMSYIFGDSYKKKIFDRYTEVYVDNRYSNYEGNNDRKTIARNLTKAFAELTNELRTEEPLELLKKVEKFYNYVYFLDQLYYLEQQKKAIKEIDELRKKDLGIDDDNFSNSFSLMVNEDIKKRKDFLNNFNSDTFSLVFDKINKDKNSLKVDINNRIKFPNLYSEEAIKKAAGKDTISEDLTLVEYTLLCSKIVQDLVACDYATMYYVDFPRSIFDKKAKITRLLSIIDNQYVNEKLRLVINFECFLRYRTYIFELMRQGFFFCIFLDEKFDYSSENIEYLVTFDKIFMLNGKYYYKDMINNGKIKDKIVVVNEVI